MPRPEMPDEVSRLIRLTEELANELELEINDRYEREGSSHTALGQRHKERDLEIVERARETIKDYRQKYDCYW